MYLIALLLPPLAVLLSGGPVITNFVLTCLGYIPGQIHAIAVVKKRKDIKRNRQNIIIYNNDNPRYRRRPRKHFNDFDDYYDY